MLNQYFLNDKQGTRNKEDGWQEIAKGIREKRRLHWRIRHIWIIKYVQLLNN